MSQPDEIVVVITGASSGIGRATARRLAAQGASVVLAARRAGPLEAVAKECRAAGAQALVVPTDVADHAAVDALAAAACQAFGGIDVWVNNAGVGLFGRVEDLPLEDFRRSLDVNLWGTVHGARAVLPHFRERRRGVLINVSSLDGRLSAPFAGAYVAAKHAVRGLGMALRQELWVDGLRDVHVCTVLPATIDTPFFQHAANYVGRPVKAMPPVYTPERAARTIANLARRPRREVFVGPAGRILVQQAKLAPGLTERLFAAMVDRKHFDNGRRAAPTSGSLFAAMADGTGADGGWGGRRGTAVRRAATAGLLAAGVGVAARRRAA